MLTLQVNCSPSLAVRSLRHLVLRLVSRPDTRPLAKPVEDALARLRAADAVWSQAVDQRVTTTSELAYLDEIEGTEIMKLSRGVLALVGGNRHDPRWVALFPTPPSEVVRGRSRLDQQAAYARNVLDTLVRLPAVADLAASFVPALTKCREDIHAVEARRELAETKVRQTSSDRAHALSDAVLVHNNTALHLRLLFPRHNALVNSFFVRAAKNPAHNAEPASPPEVETQDAVSKD